MFKIKKLRKREIEYEMIINEKELDIYDYD